MNPWIPVFTTISYIVFFIIGWRYIRGNRRLAVATILSLVLFIPSFLALSDWHTNLWLSANTIHLDGSEAGIGLFLSAYARYVVGGILFGGFSYRIANDIFRGKTARFVICGLALVLGEFTSEAYGLLQLDINQRPPTEACIKSTLYFDLHNQKLALPANPSLLVNTGIPSTWTVYPTFIDRPQRELCSLAGNSGRPFSIVALYTSFHLIDEHPQDRSSEYSHKMCKSNDTPASKLLCEATKYKPASPRVLTGIHIFWPEKYKVGGIKQDYYSDLTALIDTAKTSGNPMIAKPSGMFDVYDGGFYVARDSKLPGVDGHPFTMKCTDSKLAGAINCLAFQDLKDGLEGQVQFTSPLTDLDANAVVAQQAVPEFLSLISRP